MWVHLESAWAAKQGHFTPTARNHLQGGKAALRTSGALYVLDLAVVTRLVLCYLGKGPSKAIASAGGIDVHVADSDGHTSLF
jgi:hypothetical protein